MAIMTENRVPKYLRIQETIAAQIREGALKPGDRLPSEKALCGLHGVALGTIQKALDRLALQNILVRRHGSGTYVRAAGAAGVGSGAKRRRGGTRTAPDHRAGDASAAPFTPRAKVLRLHVDSNLSHQMRFWRATIEAFEKSHPFVRVALEEANGMARAARPDAPVDLIECGAGVPEVHEQATLADLSSFSGFASQAAELTATPFLAPVHLGVPCLAYNRSLLEKLKIGTPEHRDFGEQMAYIRAVSARATAVLGEGTAAESYLEPATFAGITVVELIQALHAGRTVRDLRHLTSTIAETLRLRDIMWGAGHAHGPGTDAFARGRVVLFPCVNTRSAWCLAQDLGFKMGVHPFLAADDSIPCGPIGIGLSRNTQYPLEGLRFIAHLQSEAEQKRLGTCGMVPAMSVDLGGVLAPRARYGADALSLFARKVRVRRIAGHVDHYLLDSLINAELIRAATPESFLERVTTLGRDYLAFARR